MHLYICDFFEKLQPIINMIRYNFRVIIYIINFLNAFN